jgi:5-methylcytosine-specific restriction endonuclease McrA
MTKIELGGNTRERYVKSYRTKNNKQYNKLLILNKIRCKIMDSHRRKKAGVTTNKKGGLIKYLKRVFTPCIKPNNDTDDQEVVDGNNVNKKPNRKAKIPLAMKQTVWVNQFGEVYKHKCVTKWCHRIITVFDFEVGHNIPESKGGATDPENLRPICRQCNIGMGNRYTIDEWSKKVFLKK